MKNFDFKTIKTFEDACRKLGINPLEFERKYSNLEKSDLAFGKLKLIFKAINDGWVADYFNDKEYKYYPWFKWDNCSGFSFDVSYYCYSVSSVGSLLSTNTKKKSDYIGKQFIDLYNQMFTSENELLVNIKITKKKTTELGLL